MVPSVPTHGIRRLTMQRSTFGLMLRNSEDWNLALNVISTSAINGFITALRRNDEIVWLNTLTPSLGRGSCCLVNPGTGAYSEADDSAKLVRL